MVDPAKLSSVFIIFGLSVISGITSIATVKYLLSRLGISEKFKKIISVLNCFSGGVFFATSILDLLPEARESMENALEHYDVHTHYPLTELLLCVGFFLILSMEHVAHICCSGSYKVTTHESVKGRNSSSAAVGKNGSFMANSTPRITDDSVAYEKTQSKSKASSLSEDNAILVRNDIEDSSYIDDITYQTYGTVDASLDKTSLRPYAGVVSRENTPHETAIIFGDSEKVVIRNNPDNIGLTHETTNNMATAFEDKQEDPSLSRLRGLVLMIALSLHMVFDGLALGLLSQESKIWQLLAALALHKVLVFLTIGLQALEILSSVKKAVLVIIIFALVSPFGILIGETIHSSGDEVSRDTVSAILQGIATGTFLFVTFFEILQRELGTDHHNLTKVLITILGFLLVAALRLMEHEEHE